MRRSRVRFPKAAPMTVGRGRPDRAGGPVAAGRKPRQTLGQGPPAHPGHFRRRSQIIRKSMNMSPLTRPSGADAGLAGRGTAPRRRAAAELPPQDLALSGRLGADSSGLSGRRAGMPAERPMILALWSGPPSRSTAFAQTLPRQSPVVEES